jgi:predicted chitinase
MQLTWKKQYIAFDNWLQKNGFSHDYNKVLSEPDEGFKNMELDILSGMWFWDKTDCNETADKIESGSTQDEFDKITKKINTGLDASEKRKEIFEKAYSKLKK